MDNRYFRNILFISAFLFQVDLLLLHFRGLGRALLKLSFLARRGTSLEERRHVLAPGRSLKRDAETKASPERSNMLEAPSLLCRNVPCEVKGS